MSVPIGRTNQTKYVIGLVHLNSIYLKNKLFVSMYKSLLSLLINLMHPF